MYKEIEGDLIEFAKQGMFDVIAHGCNCFCRMKRGIAPQMADAFGCDSFGMEHEYYEADINKLGTINFMGLDKKTLKRILLPNIANKQYEEKDNGILYVTNCYTQYHWDTKTKPFDYDAFTLCMRKINHIFKDRHIGLPKIGAGLAGGIWNSQEWYAQLKYERQNNKEGTPINAINIEPIKLIIERELKDCDVTVVIYKK